MKIGVNARMLINPYTGIGQHTRFLLKELTKIDTENEYFLVTHEKVSENVMREFPKNVTFTVIPDLKRWFSGVKKTWWEQISVPDFFIKNKVDLAYFTYPSNPWREVLKKKNISTLVTIHDLIPWKIKKYQRTLLSRLYHIKTKKAVNKADSIITVSETSKKDILDIFHINEKKLQVVYNDCSPIYKQPVDEGFTALILEKFNLKRNKFFLYCGGFDERKNIKKLADEYCLFCSKSKELYPLVLTGGKLFDNKLFLSLDYALNKKCGKIINTGFLEEQDLNALYKTCTAFVHLSKEEGFNIPLLEAANLGAPLILSNIPVHKEIAGRNALFADIEKTGDAAYKMENVLNEKQREAYKEKSLKLASKYSWKKSALKLKNVIYSLLKSK